MEKSCLIYLAEFLWSIKDDFNKNSKYDIVEMNINEVFDEIPHARLIKKLIEIVSP